MQVSHSRLLPQQRKHSVINQLHDDRLVAADYWGDELVILSAGMGFDNIVRTPSEDFDATIEAMGSWYGEPD